MRKKLDLDFVATLSAAIRDRATTQPTTWSDVEALSTSLGVKCSRQWLCKNGAITAAYEEVKKARRSGDAGRVSDDSPLGRAHAKIAKLQLDILKLNEVIRLYDEKLFVLLQSARASGLNVRDLEVRTFDPRQQTQTTDKA